MGASKLTKSDDEARNLISLREVVVVIPFIVLYFTDFFSTGGNLLLSSDDFEIFANPNNVHTWARPAQSLVLTIYTFGAFLVLVENLFFRPLITVFLKNKVILTRIRILTLTLALTLPFILRLGQATKRWM